MARQEHSRKKKAKKVLRKSGKRAEVHCMLIPTDSETVVLPTSVMAEVIDFQQPLAMDSAPSWLLGQIEWENRQVPVFSFSALINATDVGEVPAKSKIMILKSLSDSAKVPYLGILLDDLPRPINIKEGDLEETGDDKKSLGVYRLISVDEHEAIIPDLDRLTHLVTHATYGALPITQLDS